MKRIFVFLFCSFVLANYAFTHPPKNINVAFEKQRISVVVEHNVTNPQDHYIEMIKITLNKKPLVKQDFYVQENATNQIAEYFIPGLKKSDTLIIEAECSKFGTFSKSFTVK